MFKMTDDQLESYKARRAEQNKQLLASQAGALSKDAPNRPRIKNPSLNITHKSEHDVQVTFIKYLKLLMLKCPELALGYAVPNGGMRNKAVAGKLKAEGVISGVPDWHLPVSRKIWHGLWIEFKHGKNKLSENQVEYIAMLRQEGHLVEVCYTADEALGTVMRYMGVELEIT